MAPRSVTKATNKEEEQLEARISELRSPNPDLFDRMVGVVKHKARCPYPLFPKVGPVSSVKPVPPEELEAFRQKYIDDSYIKWGTEEAEARCVPGSIVRSAQYSRWEWACDNMVTYINVLRVAGHTDDAIQAMIDGRPMCFRDDNTFQELREALRELAPKIEKEKGWESVGFIFTGSSVPGFSQNPLKGRQNEPTRITSTEKSDVDICIKADGVEAYAEKLRENGEKVRAIPTTCSETKTGTRFMLPWSELETGSLGAFYEEWKKRLPGGLQITYSEDALDFPPWETAIL